MLDIQLIRERPEAVKEGMRSKGYDHVEVVDELLSADEQRRSLTTQVQEIQTFIKERSREIAPLMKSGQQEEANQLRAETAAKKETLKQLEDELRACLATYTDRLLEIPNLPHGDVPIGRSPADNVVDGTWSEPTALISEPRPHWDILEQHHLADFERGAKVTGAGFPFYVGQGARLQRALVQFFLDQAATAGYVEVQAPLLVNESSARATGQLPDKEGQMYHAAVDDFYLIPTAEVPVTNFHRDEILSSESLPIKYCAYTPCFRREAGSYGKDVRGLNRLHQFDKVELVQITAPSESYDAMEMLRQDAERLLQALDLPYRRLLMCTADMGFTQAKKYDLEVWSPGQDRWLEVSSISNFEDYQARRLKLRYRPAGGGSPAFVHTLNGSGLALPRIVAALLERYQLADGSVAVPEVLQPYTGFDRLGTPRP